MLWKPPPKEQEYGPCLDREQLTRSIDGDTARALDEMLTSLDRLRRENKALVAEVERLRVLLLAHGVGL